MSREFLFRGISEKTKQWVFGGISSNCTKVHGFKVIPESIGQFTGLTDKNGVKIFEGDVIRVSRGVSYIEVVNWNNFGFESIRFLDSNQIQVIGNVFENPELIGVQNE